MRSVRTLLASFLFLSFCIPAKSAEQESTPFFSASTQIELLFQEEVKGLGHNFSAVSYVPSNDHFLILDDSCQIYQVRVVDHRIQHVQTTNLKGFHDCEALVYLPAESKPGMKRLGVTEERLGNVAFFDLKDDVPQVVRGEADIYQVEPNTSLFRRNSGLEAMTVDDTLGNESVFYLGKEEHPRKIYRALFKDKEKPLLNVFWSAEDKLPKVGDIAELAFLEGKLFVLNERQDKIHQLDPRIGIIISEYQLPPSGRNKYEGLSIVPRGNGLYEMMIVAEKHRILFYQIRQ